MYAYIDESGDTGISSKSSKYFIITAIIVEDKDRLEKDVKKFMKKLLKINKNRAHYFHAYKETEKVRSEIISIAIKNNCKCVSFIIDKKIKDMYKFHLDKMLKVLSEEKVRSVLISNYNTNKNFINKIRENNSELNINFMLGQSNFGLQVVDCYSYTIFNNLSNKEDSSIYKKISETVQIKQNP